MRHCLFLLCLLIAPIPSAQSASTQSKLRLPKRSWNKELTQACQVPSQQIAKLRPYLLQRAGETSGFVLAQVWKSKASRTSVLYILTYRTSSKSGWRVGRCLKLLQEDCSAKSKPICEHQVRASQLIDLRAPNTTVQPENGSWFGHRVLEPKTTTKWPLLFVQSRIIRGSGDKRRSQTRTVMLSLRTQQPKSLMTLVTTKRWPVVMTIGRKQDPIGVRMQELRFTHATQQPIQLTTIQVPIPSPFDKCCKPKKTFQQYNLSTEGFTEVQSL